jgi:hypothetical protein
LTFQCIYFAEAGSSSEDESDSPESSSSNESSDEQVGRSLRDINGDGKGEDEDESVENGLPGDSNSSSDEDA